MGKPRAVRKQPVVVSSDSDESVQHSPPPKRPKRGAQESLTRGDTKPSRPPTRRASSPKPSSPTAKKKKAASKAITSFFNAVPRPQSIPPTSSPEKHATPTLLDDDDILDSSEDGSVKARPSAIPIRKRKAPVAVERDTAPRGSQRFFRAASAPRRTPTPSLPPPVQSLDRRPWNEKYGPISLDELAVHKRKVSDIRIWLEGVFSGKERKRLLLLKGPAGSGKTATMSILSKDMGFHMHEWKNPIGVNSSLEGYVSATTQFEDFVSRAGTFGSLAFDGPAQARPQSPAVSATDRGNQLILVEEFPNTFTRTSSVLQSFRSSILNFLAANTPSAAAFFSGKGQGEEPITPIVMIVSETLLSTNTAAADSFTAHRLLGPEILTHSAVTAIEFNPVAPTFMAKALDLVVVKEARKSGRKKTVGPQVIQRLSELGDIRSAVSSLEFLCLRGDDAEGWGAKVNFTKKKGPKDVPITPMEQESLEMITQRESTLGIFHAVGRVLYNKRQPENPNNPAPQPPNYFPDRRRPKASEVNIDTLIDELGTDTHTFVSALHENYVLSCDAGDKEETLDCISGSIDALSDADLLSPDRFSVSGFGRRNFQGSSADNLRQDELSFQASVRGLLYSLPHPVKRISPPPGVMGAKAKGAGVEKEAARGSAYVMYYPSSLRLWRQQEEIGGLLELWISRAQRGHLFASHAGPPKPSPSVTGGVDTWRKTHSSTQSFRPARQTDTSPILLGSGASARNEMLLERLPYLPLLLRRHATFPQSVHSSIQEIRKITGFSKAGSLAVSPSASAEDDLEAGDDVVEGEAWATDRPGAETPRKRKKKIRMGIIEDKGEEMGSAGGMGLVISDDDIED